MAIGPLYSVSTEDLAAEQIDAGTNYNLSTDLEGNAWFATLDGETVTVSYRSDLETTVVGTFTTMAGSTTNLHSVPVASGAGIYLLEGSTDTTASVKLRLVSTSTITLVSTISVTGYQYVGGLTWTAAGDLLFIGDNDAATASRAWKVRPSDGTVRAGYPSALGAGVALAGRRGRGSVQLGPNGYVYTYYQDNDGDPDAIGRFIPGTAAVSGFEQVFNISTPLGATAIRIGFTVLEDGSIHATAQGSEGAARHFLWDGEALAHTLWSTLTESDFAPGLANDDTAPAIWQTATLVYFAGSSNSVGSIVSLTHAGVFEELVESTETASALGNSRIGNNCDQARVYFDTVVVPQLDEAPPEPVPEADTWFFMSQVDASLTISGVVLPPVLYGVAKASPNESVAEFTGANGEFPYLLARDFNENTFFGVCNGSTLVVRSVASDGTVSSAIGTISSFTSSNTCHAVGNPTGSGCYVLVRRVSGPAQANLYSITTSSVTLLGSVLVTNHAAPVGLSWNADGDLVTMALEDLGGSTYRWSVLKIDPTTGSVRAGFPLAWPSASVNSSSAGAAIQLRSNGVLYVGLQNSSNVGQIWTFAVDSSGFTQAPAVLASQPTNSTMAGAWFSVDSSGNIIFQGPGGLGPQLYNGSTWTQLVSNVTSAYVPATGAGDQFRASVPLGASYTNLAPATFVGTVDGVQKWGVLGQSLRFGGPCLRLYSTNGTVFATIPFNRTGSGSALQQSQVSSITPNKASYVSGNVSVVAVPYNAGSDDTYADLDAADKIVSIATLGTVQLYGSLVSFTEGPFTGVVTPTYFLADPTSIAFGVGACGFASTQRNFPNTLDPDGYALTMVRTAQGV